MAPPVDKQTIREYLSARHSETDLKAWFDPLHFHVLESGTLEIRFPHALFSNWFGKERQKRLEKELTGLHGYISRVVYLKPGNRRVRAAAKPEMEQQATRKGNVRNAQFSFDTFIYNKKNEFPVTMAHNLAVRIADPLYIPFVICGKGSCGKTHLLRAMAGTMEKTVQHGDIYIGTVEDAGALFAADPTSFKQTMLRYKAIFLDNGQNLTAFPDLQQELVLIADSFKEYKKNFVLTIDDGLDQAALNPKLRARLESGLSVTVKKPDLDVRMRYTKAQCAAQRIQIKKELLLPIAQRFASLNMIQGIIAKAAAFQLQSGKPLTPSDMEKILAGMDSIAGKSATAPAIINLVAEAFSVTPEDIMGMNRRADAVLARQTAMYLCRKLLAVPYTSLGQYFYGKNHSTVMYAFKKIEKRIEDDKVMNKLITKIQKKFLSRQT